MGQDCSREVTEAKHPQAVFIVVLNNKMLCTNFDFGELNDFEPECLRAN